MPLKLNLLLSLTFAGSLAALDLGSLSRSTLGAVVATCAADFALTSSPAPCQKLVPGQGGGAGYVVIREPGEARRTILSPLSDLAGIENPSLVSLGAPNYFRFAWNERAWVTDNYPDRRSRSDVALAINSEQSRTQDHLHIHIACVRTDIRAALDTHAVAIGTDRFRMLNFRLGGIRYWAKAVTGRDLDWNAFRLVAEGVPRAKGQMGNVSIGVIGTVLPGQVPGFYVLADISTQRHEASAERLLDPSCSSQSAPL